MRKKVFANVANSWKNRNVRFSKDVEQQIMILMNYQVGPRVEILNISGDKSEVSKGGPNNRHTDPRGGFRDVLDVRDPPPSQAGPRALFDNSFAALSLRFSLRF